MDGNNKHSTKRDGCIFKCIMCQNYKSEKDFCEVKQIKDCSRRPPVEFSDCQDYLIHESLIMF